MSAFNGSGTFVISGTGLPYVTGTVISSTVANQLNTDLATGLSNCLTKDGQTVPVANIPMGGFRLTGLGAPVAPGDALVWGQPASISTLTLTDSPFVITKNWNGTTFGTIQNNDTGNQAAVRWTFDTTVANMNVGLLGVNVSASGMLFGGAAFMVSTANLVIGVSTAGNIIFGTSNAEKMRLDSNGTLCINTATPDPSYKLSVNGAIHALGQAAIDGSISTSDITAHGTGGNAGTVVMTGFGRTRTDNTAQIFTNNGNPFQVSNNSTNNFAIGVQLVDAGNSWASYSDERMKADLVPIMNASEKVGILRAMTGRYTIDPVERRRSFLIAQDVQAVLPEAVTAYGEDGMLSLSYTDVIPLLVAALKEQFAIGASVNARLTAGGL